MRFELKVIGSLFLTLTVFFSLFNVYLFITLAEKEELYLVQQSKLLIDSKLAGLNPDVPEGIRITEERMRERISNYELSTFYKGYFVYFERGLVYNRIKSFVFPIFLGEILVTFLLTLTFYILLRVFYKEERKYRELLGIILLASTHRMGNFISTLKLNLEVLKTKKVNMDKKVETLTRQTSLLEEDFKKNLKLINSILDRKKHIQNLNISEEIKEVIMRYKKRFPEKNVYFKINLDKSSHIKINSALFRSLLDIITENAFMHSIKSIKLYCQKTSKGICILVSNDIAEERTTGSGIGLEIAHYIARLLGVELVQRIGKRRFKTLIRIN